MASYYHGNVNLSPPQIAQVLWQAGFRNMNAIAQMVSIAQRESGGRAGAHRTDSNPSKLSGDMGLFQINYGNADALMRAGIIQSRADLFDPVKNARAAFYLARGDSMQGVMHNWGVGKGGWVGSGGSVPKPNYTAVQNAQRSGILNRPYTPTGGGSAGPSGPGGAPSYGGGVNYNSGSYPGLNTLPYDPSSGQSIMQWLAQQQGASGNTTPLAGNFFDVLNSMNLAGAQTDAAYTQMQKEYAEKMAGFEQELLGLNMTALGYDQQALDLENAYNEAMSQLNGNLTKAQIKANADTFKELGKNISEMRDLSNKGLANSKEYYAKSNQLEADVLKATQNWLNQQKGFNTQDYRLTIQQINNVLTAEADRFDLTKAQADLQQRISRRQKVSESTAAGAMTSRGHGAALDEFQDRRDLAVREGEIGWNEAQGAAGVARGRANLGFHQAEAEREKGYGDAWRQYQGATLANRKQWQDAYGSYASEQERLRHGSVQGYTDFMERYRGLQHQQGSQAAKDAYDRAMFGINKLGLQNTGRRYGINAAQGQAQLGNTVDQLQYQLAQGMYSNPLYTPDWSGFDPYAMAPSGGGPSSGGSGTGSAGRPSGGLGRPARSGGTTSTGRPRSPFDPQPV